MNRECSPRKAFAISFEVRVNIAGYFPDIAAEISRKQDVGFLLRNGGVKKFEDGVLIDTRLARHAFVTRERLKSLMLATVEDVALLNTERFAVLKQLMELGYRVAVPDYGFYPRGFFMPLKSHTRIFKADPPIIARMGKKKEYPCSIFWTRDLWNHIGGMRVRHFGTNGGLNLLGEGGYSLPIGENATIMSNKLSSVTIVRDLAARGHRFYFMEDGVKLYERLSKLYSSNVYITFDHVDLFVGMAGRTLVVDPLYYQEQNKEVLDTAVSENGLELLQVPKKEENIYPANFLPLNGESILMDNRAGETASLLRKKGVEVIPTLMPPVENMKCDGGVRCFTNEMYY